MTDTTSPAPLAELLGAGPPPVARIGPAPEPVRSGKADTLVEQLARLRAAAPTPVDPPEADPRMAARANLREAWEALIPRRFQAAKLDQLDVAAAWVPPVADWAGAPSADGLPNLVLAGAVGTGKTHAAVAAVRPHFARGARVAWWPLVELLQAMRPGGDDRAYQRAARADVLVLDDLGAHKATDWADEQLYALVNRRWMDERPIVATCNVVPDKLADVVGERIASRLLGDGALVVEVTGPDRRLT